jgi:hypothetical protein
MVSLAAPDRIAGELTVTNIGTGEAAAPVTVNGEEARTGRSIFSSSLITTPSNAGAVINIGKTGIIELAPNTAFTIAFDEKSVNGDLSSGWVTVLSSSGEVSVRTANGDVVKVNAGESVNANGKKDDPDDTHGGAAWWLWAIVFGGAAAVILIEAAHSQKISLGGTAVTVSPTR